MDIYRMQNEAKDRDGDQLKFKIIGPLGEKQAKWLDPWFGFLTLEGQDPKTFTMMKDLADIPLLDFVWAEAEPSKEMG